LTKKLCNFYKLYAYVFLFDPELENKKEEKKGKERRKQEAGSR
jgi:hypothetical protein